METYKNSSSRPTFQDRWDAFCLGQGALNCLENSLSKIVFETFTWLAARKSGIARKLCACYSLLIIVVPIPSIRRLWRITDRQEADWALLKYLFY